MFFRNATHTTRSENTSVSIIAARRRLSKRARHRFIFDKGAAEFASFHRSSRKKRYRAVLCRVPGKGRTPWHEIACALRDIDYRGSVVMEPFVRMGGTVGSDIKIWRDISCGADEARLDADAASALEFERYMFETL